jgi:hypothetical protein
LASKLSDCFWREEFRIRNDSSPNLPQAVRPVDGQILQNNISSYRGTAMNEPKCCAKHPHGILTKEFIAHLPTCAACQRALQYLNDEQDKLAMLREKARWN